MTSTPHLRLIGTDRSGPKERSVEVRRSPVNATGRSPRALVIDDDDIARELLVEVLEKAGNEVYQLPSAIGATRVIAEQAIDVVVLDVVMPSVSGDKLARLLRQGVRGSQLVIILVSSRSVTELANLATVAGADAIVPKSEIRSQLASVIAATIERRAQEQSSPSPSY